MPAKDDTPRPSARFTRLFNALLRARSRLLEMYTDPDLGPDDYREIGKKYDAAAEKLFSYVVALESAARPKE